MKRSSIPSYLSSCILFYCCPVNNYSPLFCFVIQCFISIFTKGACLYTMRAESPIITLLVLPDSNIFISQDRGGGKESAMDLNDEVNPPGYPAFARLP